MSGHSFGGWTTLDGHAREPRIRAALPLAPAGGWTPMPAEPLREALDFAWGRDVPTLYLVADRDTLLPLRGMRELHDKTPGREAHGRADQRRPHAFLRSGRGDPRAVPHDAAAGRVRRASRRACRRSASSCRRRHGYLFIRGLGLAHMDAVLRGDAGGEGRCSTTPWRVMAARGAGSHRC